jgi:hypothetical protein
MSSRSAGAGTWSTSKRDILRDILDSISEDDGPVDDRTEVMLIVQREMLTL